MDEIWRTHRAYLVDLAFRMTNNIYDAEDVVQEAFARLLNVDVSTIEDLRAWLVVVVTRLCLDQFRSARHRRESAAPPLEPSLEAPNAVDPADRVTLDESVRMALLVVLEQLTPAERAVFVLHDVFQFPFERVAEIVGRTPAACRQLASRARRHVESSTGPGRFEASVDDQHRLATSFIEACAGGDVSALLQILDPDVVGVVDLGPSMSAPPVRGSDNVSRRILIFFGPASGMTLVSQPINGTPGVLAFTNGELFAMMTFKVRDDRIYDIHSIADPAKLAFASSQLA